MFSINFSVTFMFLSITTSSTAFQAFSMGTRIRVVEFSRNTPNPPLPRQRPPPLKQRSPAKENHPAENDPNSDFFHPLIHKHLLEVR